MNQHFFTLLIAAWCCGFSPAIFADTPLTAAASNSIWSFAGISSPATPANAELLPPDQAYHFSAVVETPTLLRLTWTIAKGTFLYKNRLHLSLEDTKDVELAAFTLPAGIIKQSAVRPEGDIGEVEVYHDSIDLAVPLHRLQSAAPTRITLIAKYQGCAEIGVCYPPQTKNIALELPAVVATTTVSPTIPPPPLAESDQLASQLQHGSLWGIVATFFGLGLLLAFTPCIFPMIPILSGIIVGQGTTITTRRAFLLSLVYVLAMSAAYTVVGILAGLFGQNLQAVMQNAWVLSSFSLLFVILSLSMFGLYDLQLPTALQTKATAISNNQKSGSLVGASIMGLLSALIVGPCVAPPLAGALIYIGQTGDALLGGLALFALSFGMGTPLLIIGSSAGSLLPRAGAWMNTVKIVFGVILLGVAIVIVERILPAFIIMLLWGSLLICLAIYLGALRTAPINEKPNWQMLWQGLGIIMLIYGTLILIGASAGNSDVIMPLRGMIFANDKANEPSLDFQPIKNIAELDRALIAATAQKIPVILDFYADWCVSCKELESDTLANSEVQTVLKQFVRLRADITANDNDAQQLQKRFGIIGPPAIIFYSRQGQELRHLRIIGFMPATQFSIHAQTAIQ